MKRFLTLLALTASLTLNAVAQHPSDLRRQYEEFKANRRKAYADFKAQCNAEFAEFLKQEWKNFRSEPADETPIPVVTPRPSVIPVEREIALPTPDVRPNITAIEKIAADARPVDITVVETYVDGIEGPVEEVRVTETSKPRPSTAATVDFNFFGDALQVPWDKTMTVTIASVDEKGFSEAWSAMANAKHQTVTDYVSDYCTEHHLNGWGYYQLVKKFSEQVYPDTKPNERIATQAFLLSQMKFKAQVASCNNALVLLLPFREQVYSVPFLTINGTRYYIYSYSAAGAGGGYRTYEKSFAYADRQLSLEMDGKMNVGVTMDMEINRWSTMLGEKLSVPMGVGNIALLLDYPIVDAELYYRQTVPSGLGDRVLESVRRKIEGMSETEAVSFLLDLVQNGFVYETDNEMFGRQKQLFVEESFYYGRNNCKDRVAVFSWLVKNLVHLDVIFVRFEGNAKSNGVSHITCAVEFSTPVNGDAFNYRDKRYVMCDPTYINAGIGMTMPCYADSQGIILKI